MTTSLAAAITLCEIAAFGSSSGWLHEPAMSSFSNCSQKYDGGLHCSRLMKKYTAVKTYMTARQP